MYAGRVIALCGFLSVAFFIGRYVRVMGGSLLASVAAALLFVARVLVWFRPYVGMDDPQWLGHAMQAGGVLLVLRWTAGRGRLGVAIVAALLIVGGVFIKHNLLAAPAAVTFWLALIDRRRLLVWLLAAGAIAVAGGLLCYGIFGWSVVQQVVLHRRFYSLDQVARTLPAIIPLSPYAVAGAVGGWTLRKNQVVWLVAIYAVLSLMLGIVIRGGRGVNVNALFDLLIGLTALAGLLVWTLERRLAGKRSVGQLGVATGLVLLFVSVIPMAASAWHERLYTLRSSQSSERAYEQAYQKIAETTGQILCQDPTVCYWGGKASSVDVANTAQLVQLDPVIGREVADTFAHRDYALVVLRGHRVKPLGAEVNKALVENYQPIPAKQPVYLYAPKSP